LLIKHHSLIIQTKVSVPQPHNFLFSVFLVICHNKYQQVKLTGNVSLDQLEGLLSINRGVDMNKMLELNNFLNKLTDSNIFYRLNKVRCEAIMVEITVPGQRWEIEFMEDGTIEIEKFISDGAMYDVAELEVLLKEFSD
jgi:hypothetical protein